MERRTQALTAAAGIGAGLLISQRIKPMPCPYSQRWMLEIPRPNLGRDDIVRALDPRAGESVLELGPGTGYHSFAVAERLEPDGELHAFDIQQKMLDHLMRLAAERGAANIRPRQGDAREMPYADEQFDAAFLVTVLGEIPDEDRALAELHRVIRPGGRLVIGEMAFDPHYVRPSTLRRHAEDAGFAFVSQEGTALSYTAQFVRE
jgi:ubiquinone/menaquinone biosynthesis C-methylase UbiE